MIVGQNHSRTLSADLHKSDLVVLSLIGGGLIVILLSIIAGLFLSKGSSSLPNWAENVLVATSTACTLKLGDVLSSLVALASGRVNETFGRQLGQSQPQADPPPKDAAEGARQAADAADETAASIEAKVEGGPRPKDPLDLAGAELPEDAKGDGL